MGGGGEECGCADIAYEDHFVYVSIEKCPVDDAALKEEIGDNIRKGDQSRKFEAMRHGCTCFQDIIGAKESIKGFIQRGEESCVWGYCDGSVLWHVVDRWHSASKWGWIFPSAEGK